MLQRVVPVLSAASATAADPVSATTMLAAGLVQQDEMAAQTKQQRLLPMLSSFHSVCELCHFVQRSNAMADILSFAKAKAANSAWQRSWRQRFHEFKQFLEAVKDRAAIDHVTVSEMAQVMDTERITAKMPVAKFVKVTIKTRADRRKGMYAELVCVK